MTDKASKAVQMAGLWKSSSGEDRELFLNIIRCRFSEQPWRTVVIAEEFPKNEPFDLEVEENDRAGYGYRIV